MLATVPGGSLTVSSLGFWASVPRLRKLRWSKAKPQQVSCNWENDCYRLNSPNGHTEGLPPSVMVLGGRAFGKCLGQDREPVCMILVPPEGGARAPPAPSTAVRTVRRACSQTGKRTHTRHPVCWGLDLELLSLQNRWRNKKYISIVSKPTSLWSSVRAAWTDYPN